MKKLLVTSVMMAIIVVASGVGVYARSGDQDKNPVVKIEKQDLNAAIYRERSNAKPFSEKSTMAEYERQKAQGKRFSTGAKIAIGVGIAAAVIGIVVFAASRDKVRTF